MAFKDSYGELINSDHKVRISLSPRSRIIMLDDMNHFGLERETSFINLIFKNFYLMAQSSISLSLQKYRIEIDQLLSESSLDNKTKEKVIDVFLKNKEKMLIDTAMKRIKSKGTGKLYRIQNDILSYLTEDCDENIYYSDHIGKYIHAVIEEYCELPFIKREQIVKSEEYHKINSACINKTTIKITKIDNGKRLSFHVFPYKIVADPNNTQEYLVGYTKRIDEGIRQRKMASFAMSRISNITELPSKPFSLSQREIIELEKNITERSPAYLLDTPALIKIRLTKAGKQLYNSRLFGRPEKQPESTEEVYIFECSERQIYNFFFSFGQEAEVLEPASLRNRFIESHTKSLELY